MAEWIEQRWTPLDGAGLGREARRGGTYLAFSPDLLSDRELKIPTDLAKVAQKVEHKILRMADTRSQTRVGTGTGLEGIARFLLRSEAISSSRIEGMAPGPDKVAIAELAARDANVRAPTIPQLVANNVSVLMELSRQVREANELVAADLIAAQLLLLGDDQRAGFRETQNWIGGGSYSPLEAEFVPPPAKLVPALLADLVDYLNGATHGALIQAAMVHAQFETIHPFADGNGRVGRALIHVILQQRGLVRSPVLPISMILATWSDRYVHGLTRFRDLGPGSNGVLEWIEIFLDAASSAVDQAERIARELDDVRAEWEEMVITHRTGHGKTRALRSDSIERKILDSLPDHPLLTTAVAAEVFGVSPAAAGTALNSLEGAGVLRRRSVGKGVVGYLADDVFEMITLAERRLASTRFDTVLAPPSGRAVPVKPGRSTQDQP